MNLRWCAAAAAADAAARLGLESPRYRDEEGVWWTVAGGRWQAWRTDLSGKNREDLASVKLPECACATGVCGETCPVGAFWAPDEGVDKIFLMTQYIAGQTERTFKITTLYQEESGKWTAKPLPQPLEQPLDASPAGDVIVHAIPDAACCGWSNQSNDQTLVLSNGKSQTIFDEFATYKGSDYDVSFFTSNAKLSPDLKSVAMTISGSAQANKPIQLAEEGQANPEESLRIRKALADELLFGKLVGGGRVTIDIGPDDKIRLEFEENREAEPVDAA